MGWHTQNEEVEPQVRQSRPKPSFIETEIIDKVQDEIKSAIDSLSGLNLLNPEDLVKVKGNRVEFVMDLEGTQSVDIPIDFAAGIPGLNLDVDADVTLEFGYGFLLGFGFHFQDGFYIVTDSQLNSGRELFLELGATIADGSALSGTLGFLNLSLTEVVDEVNSGLRGSIGLDISDQDGNGRLTLSEIRGGGINVNPLFDGDLDVNFEFEAEIPEFSVFGQTFQLPKLSAKLTLEQAFDNIVDIGADLFSDLPTAFFDDVNLDLGSFISTFMAPITDFVSDYLDPVKPLVDLLTEERQFLIDLGFTEEPTFLGLGKFAGGQWLMRRSPSKP